MKIEDIDIVQLVLVILRGWMVGIFNMSGLNVWGGWGQYGRGHEIGVEDGVSFDKGYWLLVMDDWGFWKLELKIC